MTTTTTSDMPMLRNPPVRLNHRAPIEFTPRSFARAEIAGCWLWPCWSWSPPSAISVYWWTHDRFWVRTDNAYVTGNLVPVAAQASGIITQVLAEETQFVNRGDLMIRLDEHQAYAALGRARGRLGRKSGVSPHSLLLGNSWRKN